MSDRVTKLREQVSGLLASGQHTQALRQVDSYCARHPQDYNGLIYYAGLLGRLGHYKYAREVYRRAKGLVSNPVDAWFGLAKAELLLGNYEKAINYYTKVIDVNAGDFEAWFDRGNARRILGDKKGAVQDLRQAIAVNPGYADAYFSLSGLQKYSETDTDLTAMKKLLAQESIPVSDQIALNFTLAKAYNDIGDYPVAFAYLETANRLERARINYDVNNDVRLFTALHSIFTPAFIDQYRGVSDIDATPVFIIGMPRSGTTLVEHILSAHPDVFGAGELPDLSDIIFAKCAARSQQRFPAAIPTLQRVDFSDMTVSYIERLRNIGGQAQFVVDKNPANFLLVGMIYLMFPQAKVIHCRRAPVETCLSIYQQYFSDPRGYAYDLKEIGQYYRHYQGLMSYWHELLPGFIVDIDYEDIIVNQRDMTARLLSFCGLGWDDACMAFQDNKRPIATSSVEQVRQPIYTSSLNKSDHYTEHLKPLLDELGEQK